MKKRIGDILVEMGAIDTDQLQMALLETKKTGAMLGDVLRRLDWVSEEALQTAMAVQSGARILDVNRTEIDPDLPALVPLEVARECGVLPFALEEGTLKVATANPFDVVARDRLERLTGRRVETFIAPQSWIARHRDLCYQTARAIDEEIEGITILRDSRSALKEDQIVRLSGLLIEKGRILGASDLHLVPDTTLVRVYYRIDGVLQQKFLFAKAFQQPLAARYKIMADMDIANPHIPHDGRIRYVGRGGEFDIRVSTFPTHLGETVVMRLLIHNQIAGDLSELGFEPDDLARFEAAIHRPHGLVLSTGPTGSGKTTTLYAALMAVKGPHLNVMTVEDPIEYVIPTVRQTAVNPKAGLSFDNALRSALRQDPDVILVGEIRDRETADLALQASLTGHLVLSTLHTNDAASAVGRLLDIGVNAGILASALSLVIAQRLLRRLCPRCRKPLPPSAADAARFEKKGLPVPAQIGGPTGCEACFQSGYRGRTGVYEVIRVDRTIAELIYRQSLSADILDAAVRSGTTPIYSQALKKVAAGLTSLTEVERVIVDHE